MPQNISFPFSRRLAVPLAIGIICLTVFLTFLPSLGNSFTNWDDPGYITECGSVKTLSPDTLSAIWSSFHKNLYKPLVMASFALEYHFFDLDPFYYHLDNLILHIINCVLVFWLISLLSGSIICAGLTALLFGVHPMHVESVAWITERKDVLYTLFFLGSIISYMYYLKARRKTFFYLMLVSFALSLSAKPMGVTLPLVLIAVDFLVKRKIDHVSLLEKAPVFLLSAVYAGVNLSGQTGLTGGSRLSGILPFPENIFTACYAVLFYLKKLFVPVDLSALYPPPESTVNILYPAAVIFLAALILYSVRLTRKIMFGSIFFIMTLLPVIQFVRTGPALVCDRYTYVPYIGLFFIIASIAIWLYDHYLKNKLLRVSSIVLGISVITTLSILSAGRTEAWRNGITLWESALTVYPSSSLLHLYRAMAYYEAFDFKNAFKDLDRAIALDPRAENAYVRRAYLFFERNNLKASLADCQKILSLDPRFTDALFTIGMISGKQGEHLQAVGSYTKVLNIDPSYTKAYVQRAVEYMALGDNKKAAEDLVKALELDPSSVKAHYNLGFIFSAGGLWEKAIYEYTRAINSDPTYTGAYLNRAIAYLNTGSLKEAMADLEVVMENKPNARAYLSRGVALAMQGNLEGSIKDFSKALEMDPRYVQALYNRGKAYNKMKKYDLAAEDLTKAVRLDPGYKDAYSELEKTKKLTPSDGYNP